MISPGRRSRRDFLRGGLAATVLLGAGRSPAATQPTVAAVIGHTGRGDYGHGMDGIFTGRPEIRVAAVADADEAGRTLAARRIGAATSYADYREMLARERPQLVSVAPRHADQHHEMVRACLEAGAHVFCEKPFTRSPAEADELLSLAGNRGRRIAVAHTLRMMPQVRALARAVADGRLGELRELRAYGKQDHRAGGEDLMVLGSHLFDFFRLFCGDPLSVTARVRWQGRPVTAADRRLVKDNVGWVAGDQVSASFLFRDGVVGTFTSDARLRETVERWGLELWGSRGVARINADLTPQVLVRGVAATGATGRTDTWAPLDPALVPNPPDHLLAPVNDWLAAIEAGREPECSGRNGAWAVEMVCGVYAAALAGREIPFPLSPRSHPLEAV